MVRLVGCRYNDVGLDSDFGVLGFTRGLQFQRVGLSRFLSVPEGGWNVRNPL